jgi:hypothetical protein
MWAECIYPLEAPHSIKDTPTLCESCCCGLILNIIPAGYFYILKDKFVCGRNIESATGLF